MSTPETTHRNQVASLSLQHAGLRVNGERLWARLMALGRIGATPRGGVCRLALTDLDRQGREQFMTWARELGCSLRVDAIGNLFARREGADPRRPAVATGSHIDTQPTGGRFDGNFGVMAGLEVLQTLDEAGVRTLAPLEVCVWTNEEGSRFVPVMMGSGVYAGAFTLEHALSATDAVGTSVREALVAIGHAGPEPASVEAGAPRFGAYFEAHIEQGPVLEDAGVTLGVVTAALGQRWYDVTVRGMEAHAGPTPMRLRRDALLPATQLMQRVNAIALSEQPHGRGTVGQVFVHPNSRNVIPGEVRFSVDFRHAEAAGLARMDQALRDAAAGLEHPGMVIEVRQVVEFPPQPFDPSLRDLVRLGAERLGHSHMELVSGAGHDAVYVARTAPSAMIFVPCKDGISHNEVEDARPEHLAAGTDVLLQAMLARAGVQS